MVTVESTTANLRELFRGPKFEPRPPADIQNNPETIYDKLVVADSSNECFRIDPGPRQKN